MIKTITHTMIYTPMEEILHETTKMLYNNRYLLHPNHWNTFTFFISLDK